MNKKWLYIFFTLLITSGVSASVYLFTAKATDAPRQTGGPVPASEKSSMPADVHTYHELLNDYVCYGRESEWDEDEKWEKHAEDLADLQQTFESYSASVQDERLQQDFRRIAEFTERALTNHSVSSLVTVHRILHDLDILLNEYSEKLWDATYYGEEEQE